MISMQPIVRYSVDHMLNNKTKLLASSLGCSHVFNVTRFSCAKIREPGDEATKYIIAYIYLQDSQWLVMLAICGMCVNAVIRLS